MIRKIIGLDLDNTLIDYSKSIEIYSTKYLGTSYSNVIQIRNALKNQSLGIEWQRAQSWMYTEGLFYAHLAEGAVELLDKSFERSEAVHIISHKTTNTPEKFGYLDLRTPAKAWIERNLEPYGIDLSYVHFESSRAGKIERIKELKITHFVDDLIEVLTDREFPKTVKKYLYSPFEESINSDTDLIVIKRLDQV